MCSVFLGHSVLLFLDTSEQNSCSEGSQEHQTLNDCIEEKEAPEVPQVWGVRRTAKKKKKKRNMKARCPTFWKRL